MALLEINPENKNREPVVETFKNITTATVHC